MVPVYCWKSQPEKVESRAVARSASRSKRSARVFLHEKVDRLIVIVGITKIGILGTSYREMNPVDYQGIFL